MRRVTYMTTLYGVLDGLLIHRQPMQRTEYYMPWGVVTVDELSKMEYDRSPTILACFDERDDSWFEGYTF